MSETGHELASNFSSFPFSPDFITESEEDLKVHGIKEISDSLPDPKVLESSRFRAGDRTFKITFEGKLKEIHDGAINYGHESELGDESEFYDDLSHDGFATAGNAKAMFKSTVASRIFLANAESIAAITHTAGQYGKLTEGVFSESSLSKLNNANYVGLLAPPHSASYGEAMMQSTSGILKSADRLIDSEAVDQDEMLNIVRNAVGQGFTKDAFQLESMFLAEAVRVHAAEQAESSDRERAQGWRLVSDGLEESLDYDNEALVAELSTKNITSGHFDKFLVLSSRMSKGQVAYASKDRLLKDGLGLFFNIIFSDESEASGKIGAVLTKNSTLDTNPLTPGNIVFLANQITKNDSSQAQLEKVPTSIPSAMRRVASTFVKAKPETTHQATIKKAYDCAISMIERSIAEPEPIS